MWEESTHSERAGQVLRSDFKMIHTQVSKIVSNAQDRGEIDSDLDPISVAQTMVSLVLGLIVQLAAGTDINVDRYEESTRSLVTGRLWTSTPSAEEPVNTPV